MKNSPAPRIAFVIGGLTFGGTATMLLNMGGELVRRGIPVLVASLEKSNFFAEDFKRLRVPVVTQDERRGIIEDCIEATLEELAKFQPTAVIACLGPASLEILRYVPKGVKRGGMVMTDHPMFYETASLYAAYHDVAIGFSEHIRGVLATKPEFRHAEARFLTCGVVMPEKFRPRTFDRNSPVRILYLGRLDRGQKRVHLFPEILQNLVASGIAFQWSIVGKGAEEEFLRQNMRTSRPDQTVHLLPGVQYREVPGVMAQHDIFLLASDAEGLPVSLLEGMAEGMVPVVTDLESGAGELIDESTGRKIHVDDVAGYARAIVDLSNRRDEMERLSWNAHQKVEHDYSVGTMIDRWLEVFAAAPGPVHWPKTWAIKPPLIAKSKLRFSPPARMVRRLLRKLRN